jgi:TatD DNase family protein
VFDSHCHVHTAGYDGDREAVLARARAAGLAGMICVGAGAGLPDTRAAIALATAHDDVWATVGIHPHEASACDEATLATLEALAAHPRVVAVGETGLDYFYDLSPRDAQLAACRRFVQLARRVALPLVWHIRDAHADALAIARQEGAAEVGGVVHCFTGTRQEARAWLDLGLHLGVTGIVTFKRAGELPDVVKEAPLDRLLVETDSPYLAPVPLRGKRCEPAYVAHTARFIASLRGEPFEALAARTAENTRRRLRLSPPA